MAFLAVEVNREATQPAKPNWEVVGSSVISENSHGDWLVALRRIRNKRKG